MNGKDLNGNTVERNCLFFLTKQLTFSPCFFYFLCGGRSTEWNAKLFWGAYCTSKKTRFSFVANKNEIPYLIQVICTSHSVLSTRKSFVCKLNYLHSYVEQK